MPEDREGVLNSIFRGEGDEEGFRNAVMQWDDEYLNERFQTVDHVMRDGGDQVSYLVRKEREILLAEIESRDMLNSHAA